MPLSSPTRASNSPRKAVPRNRLGLAVLGIALFAMALGAPAAGAAEPPHYVGSAAEGRIVFFTTTERLVPGDTDNKRDIYMRSFDPSAGEGGEYVTREISTSLSGGNDAYDATFGSVNEEGTRVFFTTTERLAPADTDGKSDVYMRDLTTGETSPVSVGQGACAAGCGNPSDASFSGATADGNEVFFRTAERLVEGDTDNAPDVYMRDLTTATGETSLVSAGEEGCGCGNKEIGPTLRGISADGSRAFFVTEEPLSRADTDTAIDIYARDLPGGPTELVSRGDPACASCGNDSGQAAVFAGSSADGSKAFFETSEGLVPGDGDGTKDIYERAGGSTTLVSTGSQAANFKAVSAAGDRVLFVTSESLVGAADANRADDVYEWSGGAPTLVTSGRCTQVTNCGVTFEAAAADAAKVLFTTTEKLSSEDTDSNADVYEQEVGGGAPALVSIGEEGCSPCGNGEVAAHFDSVSPVGSSVIFSTEEQLSSQDSDTTDDVYGRNLSTGETTLLSHTPAGYCPVERSQCKASFAGASGNGTHVFFQTVERLTPEDGNKESDIYERELGGEEMTRLISTGNSPDIVLGPPPPVLEGTEPGSPNASTEPRIIGHAAEGVSVQLYLTGDCTGAPVVGTAAELNGGGIGVSVAQGSNTSFSAIAVDESSGESSGCSNSISYTQRDPPPPPPPPSEEGGPAPGGESGSGSGSGSSGGGFGIPGAGGGSGGHGAGGGLVAPQTTITFGPASKTRKRKVVFRFADLTGQPGTKFFCKVDRHKWGECNSPKRVAKLKLGRHSFEVKAVNAIGVWGSAPVVRKFKVVR